MFFPKSGGVKIEVSVEEEERIIMESSSENELLDNNDSDEKASIKLTATPTKN